MLRRLQPQAPDALLALIRLHAADPRPDKIDLGVGVYRTGEGETPVFAAVKAAEARLLDEQRSKAYLGPEGDLEFVRLLAPIVFGDEPGRFGTIEGVQTPGGTGAVRLALGLVKRAGGRRVLLGRPSWPNHAQIIDDLGLEPVLFDHARPGGTADLEAVLDAIRASGPDTAVLLHGCCHNPTGIDYSPSDWKAIASALADGTVFPVLDLAYQGLGHGLDEDAAGVRAVLASVPEALVAYSCDKNFGVYRDRVGALYVTTRDAETLPAILSNANALARATWSMPPDHGAAAVRTVLADQTLARQWRDELDDMRVRMRTVRTRLSAADNELPGLGLRTLADGNGLFAMLPLLPDQIAALRADHGVYMAGSGRINVAGLHEGNTDRFLQALAAVTR